MAEASVDGLRERKQRTRSTLIEAAADLCLRQGLDNTTVEQIAARTANTRPRRSSGWR
jgi:AcrR family transcriptional regulator